MPRRPFNASPPVGALGAGGMATGAGTGTGTGPAGALPPARESQNAAASPGPGGGPGGAGPLIGGVAGAPFWDPLGAGILGLGAGTPLWDPLGAGADPPMRRSSCSRDIACTAGPVAGGTAVAPPPIPRRPFNAAPPSTGAAGPPPMPSMPLSWLAPAALPSMARTSGPLPAGAPAPLGATIPPGPPPPPTKPGTTPRPRPMPGSKPLLPLTGIRGPGAGPGAGRPPLPGRSAAAIASTPLPPPLFASFQASLKPLGRAFLPFLSATTTSGAATPSCGIAGGCDRLTTCAVGSIAPRFSGSTPCRSVAPTKSVSNMISAASPWTAQMNPRVPKGGEPESPTITTLSPRSKSPPA
mmetsp:Transcript_8952/g.40661  ORF Transcript_8952/g.40661 Transcript_8952/m.40661 type:complete len:354 (+) Transcript_8952:298-1359(+)